VLIGLLGNPVFGFTVVFASDVFHVGPAGLGALNASLGIGSVFTALLLKGNRPGSLGRTVKWALLVFPMGMAGFAVAPSAVAGGVALVVVGGCFLSVVSAANTAMQLIVADHMRGRVLAVRIMLFTLSLPVGSLVQGWISDQIGPRATVLAAAGLMLAIGLVLALRHRGGVLARLDDPQDDASCDLANSTLRHNGWSSTPPGSTLPTVTSHPRSETQ
jgi:predicted MFS family arabinose efflux permease